MALRLLRGLSLAAGTAILVGCAAQPTAHEPGEPCRATAFSVTDNFHGARRGHCTVVADNHVEVLIRPEDEGKVNNSAWYAFRIDPAAAGPARVSS